MNVISGALNAGKNVFTCAPKTILGISTIGLIWLANSLLVSRSATKTILEFLISSPMETHLSKIKKVLQTIGILPKLTWYNDFNTDNSPHVPRRILSGILAATCIAGIYFNTIGKQ